MVISQYLLEMATTRFSRRYGGNFAAYNEMRHQNHLRGAAFVVEISAAS